MEEIVLDIQNLSKSYPNQKEKALNDVSFSVHQGEKIGIIGANGSGKTTLFRLLLNLMPADTGVIRIMGDTNLESAKKYIGYVPEHQQGLENFTAAELIGYAGKMSGMDKKSIETRKAELLEWIGLTREKNQLISGFSKGMLQRVHLATALIHNPQILFLDEPMSGLDPSGQVNLKELFKNLNDYTYIFTSHNLNDVEELCRRVIIMNHGRIMEDISLTDQMEEIFTLDASPEVESLLENFSLIKILHKNQKSGQLKIEIKTNNEIFQKIIAQCNDKNIPVHKFRSRSILEDLYLKHISA